MGLKDKDQSKDAKVILFTPSWISVKEDRFIYLQNNNLSQTELIS